MIKTIRIHTIRDNFMKSFWDFSCQTISEICPKYFLRQYNFAVPGNKSFINTTSKFNIIEIWLPATGARI